MKYFRLRYLSFILACFFLIADSWMTWAQEEPTAFGPTEEVQITDAYKVIIPKGSKIERIGGQIKTQDPATYLLDKFGELEASLQKMKGRQQELEAAIMEIQEMAQRQEAQIEALEQKVVLSAEQEIEERTGQRPAETVAEVPGLPAEASPQVLPIAIEGE